MMSSAEQSVECLAWETEVLGENLLQCRDVSANPIGSEPGSNQGRRGGKLATNHLNWSVP
jgi:hypothetical protein